MQPPKAIALTNAFFSSGVLMEHTELFGREGLSPTLLKSYKKNLGSQTQRVTDKPGKTLQVKMFCVACRNQSQKLFQHRCEYSALQKYRFSLL